MDKFELDQQLLLKMISVMPSSELENIALHLREEETLSMRFNELRCQLELFDEENPDETNVKTRWMDYRESHNNLFQSLVKKYTRAYLERERKIHSNINQIDLENLVSNHPKWNRMLFDRGQGKQYRDDVRRMCFVFQLSYPAAQELMWSAGQIFELDQLRDFVIIDCLSQRIYDIEEIDARLMEHKVAVLFPSK